MRALLDRTRAVGAVALDPELARYACEGLTIETDGCIVSVASARSPHTPRGHFSDCVAYETFVNKVHLDDWLSEGLRSASLEEKLEQALLLADESGKLAEQLRVSVAVVISADASMSDVVFRFIGVRPHDVPWLGNVDEYLEPVLSRVYGADRLMADHDATVVDAR
jgi:hypothetical protein